LKTLSIKEFGTANPLSFLTMNQVNYYEFSLNNISSCFHLGYNQLSALERDLRDKSSKDHRNYILDSSIAGGV